MAYLNADIPPIYCKVRKEYLYDFKKHQGESRRLCIFGLTSMAGAAHYLTLCYQTVQSFLDCLSAAFFRKILIEPMCPICRLTSFNCGIALVIILVFICFSYLTSQRGKYFGKDKKNHYGEYLFTIDWGHPESNILDTEHSEIPA